MSSEHGSRAGGAGGSRLVAGALAGAAAFSLAAAADVIPVLDATGPFWTTPSGILGNLLIYLATGLVAGALTGLLLRIVTLGRAGAWAVFRWGAALLAIGGLGTVGSMHVLDVGYTWARQGKTSSFVTVWAAAVVIGAAFWIVLGLLARGRGAGARARTSVLVVALVAVALLGLRPLLGSSASMPAGGVEDPDLEKPDIVLIVMDTTRFDALSSNGNPHQASPNLDRIASEGISYESAYAPATWTPPSHVSLFTGTYPSTHGTFSNQPLMITKAPTIAEVLSAQGYNTFYVVSKNLLTRAAGFARGFRTAVTANVEDRVVYMPERVQLRRSRLRTSTPTVIDMAIRWIEDADDSRHPFFVFMNLNDPHTEYVPRQPWYRTFSAGIDFDAVNRQRVKYLAASNDRNEEEVDVPPTDAQALRALYDSEMAYMDAEIGRFFDHLVARPGGRPILFIATADHGELIGEHGLMYHGKYPWQELIHIPFVLWSRPALATGRNDDPVSLVDVFPTLLPLVGAREEDFPWLQGRDLFHDPAPEFAYAEHWKRIGKDEASGSLELGLRKVAVSPHAKLVWDSTGGTVLFDLDTDPREGSDIHTEQPDEASEMERALAKRFDLTGAAAGTHESVDEETLQRLKALGYLD